MAQSLIRGRQRDLIKFVYCLEPGPPKSVIHFVIHLQVCRNQVISQERTEMRITRIDIKRDDCILQVENWPSVDSVERNVSLTVQADLPVVGEVELSVVGESTVSVITPVCQNGVCQLGEWKPRKAA